MGASFTKFVPVVSLSAFKERPIKVQFGRHSAQARLFTLEVAESLMGDLMVAIDSASKNAEIEDEIIKDEIAEVGPMKFKPGYLKLPRCPLCNCLTFFAGDGVWLCKKIECKGKYEQTPNSGDAAPKGE